MAIVTRVLKLLLVVALVGAMAYIVITGSPVADALV